ncbi:hypothetical protein J717_3163 [Acinetobacter baumannii 121738]|nr:hypothetical protein J717_3163 [Acinetobacter baumannii 121738]
MIALFSLNNYLVVTLIFQKSSLVAEHLNLKNGIKHFAILVN